MLLSPNPLENLDEELSWLAFNERVLEEAVDPSNPLLERLRFIAIAASNLDEFFAVRLAVLRDRARPSSKRRDASVPKPGMGERMGAVADGAHTQVAHLYEILRGEILPKLEDEGIKFWRATELTGPFELFVEDYFKRRILPVLTPMAVDAGRPFPRLAHKRLNLAVLLQRKTGTSSAPLFAVVPVPAALQRTITLASTPEGDDLILLEDVIERYLPLLFTGHRILATAGFRVTRKAEITVDEADAPDLLQAIQAELKRRKKGAPVRLEVAEDIHPELVTLLRAALELDEQDVYSVAHPLDPTFLMGFSDIAGYADLRFDELVPLLPPAFRGARGIFQAIAERDILVHHPYESFESVLHFIRAAADDPDVLAIKQTLYRVSGRSPVVAALARAAELGKQVTVLVELKARFDEENNIAWAKKLEEAGCHVIYGLMGLKTHSKIALVVRREGDHIKRYVHLGTGNYNDITAKVYTDVGVFTANEAVGEDATAFFNHLSGHADVPLYRMLSVAPQGLRSRLLELIADETRLATPERPGRILAQINTLTDRDLIDALYAASRAGVQIDLLVRGICCLRPGVPGLSENIRVSSLVGRFLEHCRIVYFAHGGADLYFLSSADWMRRNMEARVEIMFPVVQADLQARLKHILAIQLGDNVKTRELGPDGRYRHRKPEGRPSVDAHKQLQAEADIHAPELQLRVTKSAPAPSERYDFNP